MMLLLFAALSLEAPAEAPPPRFCAGAARGNVQLAYRPYGSAVFGSDGLHCTTVKTDPDDGPAAGKRKTAAVAKAKAKRR